jgi:hypothetical protein
VTRTAEFEFVRTKERREEIREQSEGATATGACSGAEWDNTSLLARASTAEITNPAVLPNKQGKRTADFAGKSLF